MAKKKTHEQFVQEVKEKNPDIEIIGKYVNSHTKIKCKCSNGHEIYMEPGNILKGNRCLICFKQSQHLLDKSRCLWNERPDIARLLQNPEDGYVYSYGSGHKTNFICPVCGSVIYTSFNNVSFYGLSCNNCKTFGSYPNRFMNSVLQQCGVKFNDEYDSTWTDGKIYDFIVCLEKEDILIEMDGTFHYYDIFGQLEHQINTDRYKDDLAIQNGYKLIRIDSNYSSNKSINKAEYIKQSILNSDLVNYLPLENVDWDQCHIYAAQLKIEVISKLWNDGFQTLREISQKTHCSLPVVSETLKQCVKYNLINITLEDLEKKLLSDGYKVAAQKNSELQRKNKTPIMCNETGEVFEIIADAVKKYNTSSIYNCFYTTKNKCKTAGVLPDGTKLTWTKITREEYEQIKQQEAQNVLLFNLQVLKEDIKNG